ncbi:hypothetical protein F5Y17DRAFT_475786 [Xylariaceae sp. FL0594]|nr:hypothetical protein F5Y17DRAFT_475786 [Xylariaceae sp. FL0594]
MASTDKPDLEPQKIFATISHVGLGGRAPVLDAEFHGGQCRVFKVSFGDGQEDEDLAVRVPVVDNNQPDIIPMVQMEVEMLQLLEAKGFGWAPRCRGYSLSFDNPIKRPFIVLGWVKGSRLSWSEEYPRQPHRDNLLAQIAAIQMSLIECTLEIRTITARDFFERLVRNRRARVREGRILDISDQDCVDQQNLLDRFLDGEGGNTAFAMEHGDLKPDNLIVDDKHNIQSVIDWGFAAFVPIVRAAGIPRFLWPSLPSCRPSMVVRKDRESYINSFASQSSPAALYMRRWQNVADLDFHTLYLESLFSKGAHASLAAIGWKVPSH